MRRETIQTAEVLARVNARNTQRVVKELQRNTELTEKLGVTAEAAYAAGNNFTTRLESLRDELYAKGTQIDNIEEVTGETKELVTEIKESAEHPKDEA